MKCFSILLFFLASTIEAVEREESTEGEAPHLLSLAAEEDSWVLDWTPVRILGDQGVLGYKVHIWELNTVRKVSYEKLYGKLERIQKLKPKKIRYLVLNKPTMRPVHENRPGKKSRKNNDKLKPTLLAHTVIVKGSENTRYRHQAKLNVQYEIRVQAFCASSDGPISESMGIKLAGPSY